MPRDRLPKNADLYAHILPVPVGPILMSQALVVAEGKVYRTVMLLAFWYWISGCRDLPDNPSSIAALARVPVSNIIPIKSKIDAALAEILPPLKAQYERAHKTKATRAAMALWANEHSPTRAKRTAQAIEPQRFQPHKAKPYAGDERTDNAARSAVTQRSASASRHGSGLLSEANITPRK